MRLATIAEDGEASVVVVISDDRFVELELPHAWRPTMRELAVFSSDEMRAVDDWVDQQPSAAWRSFVGIKLGPAVKQPGGIYTVGLNYDGPGAVQNPTRADTDHLGNLSGPQADGGQYAPRASGSGN